MATVSLEEARSKIIDIKKAKRVVDELREVNPHIKIGLTTGVYSIPHKGHFQSFVSCKESCDVLFVIMNSRESIQRAGRMNEKVRSDSSRTETLGRQGAVDYVLCDNNYYSTDIINELKPDIFFKGAEDKYIEGHPAYETVIAYGGKVILTPLVAQPGEDNKWSASDLLTRVREAKEKGFPKSRR